MYVFQLSPQKVLSPLFFSDGLNVRNHSLKLEPTLPVGTDPSLLLNTHTHILSTVTSIVSSLTTEKKTL